MRRGIRFVAMLSAFALFGVGLAGFARAADGTYGSHLYDKFQASGSVAGVIISSDLRIDAKNGDYGTQINMENDLGFQKTVPEPRIALRWRPGHRHEIEGSYLFARRNSDKRIARDIDFADTSFTAGLRIASTFRSDLANLTYRYAFHATDRTQIGAAIGFGAYFLKVDLSSVVSATAGGAGDSVAYSASKSFTAPTATIGAYGRFRSGEQWYIEPDARVLYLHIDRFHARVFEAGGAVKYYFKPKIAAQAGYVLSAIRIDVDPKDPGQSEGVVNIDTSAMLKFVTQAVHLGLTYSF